VFDAPGAGTAGWISSQIEAKTPWAAPTTPSPPSPTSARSPIPPASGPASTAFACPNWPGRNRFLDGSAVLVAGSINQENYLDKNAYAHTGRGQFINSALINSMVLPLKANNLGLNLQCQPRDDWYAMIGASVGNAPEGQLPWTDFHWHDCP